MPRTAAPKDTIGSVKNVTRALRKGAQGQETEGDRQPKPVQPKQTPKQLAKALDKLAAAEAATAATLSTAQEGQEFHDTISQCELGYTLWPALSDTGFGTLPEMLRGQINTRTQERQNLKLFWNSVHEGRDLQQHAVQHAIIILASKSDLDMDSLTFDTRNLHTIRFQPGLHDVTSDSPAEQRAQLPILANGGHRLEVLRQFVYQDKLKVYQQILDQLAIIDTKGKGARSREALRVELETLKHELLGVTWIAKVLDRDAIEAHPQATLIKTEIASNKNQFQVPEKAKNSLTMFFDALNADPEKGTGAIDKVLRAVVEQTDSKTQRIRTVLSSTDLAYAYARLCYNHYFRFDMPFSIHALKRWRRTSSAYAVVYINWMALTFEILFSAHDLIDFPDISNAPEGYFASTQSQEPYKKAMQDICAFDELPFSEKQVRFDILNDDFYSCLTWANRDFTAKLDYFGFNKDQMSQSMKAEHEKMFKKYIDSLYAGIKPWVQENRAKYRNDPIALKIVDRLTNKCLWFTSAQLGAETYFPAYDTPHPLVISEFIITLCDSMVEHEESIVMIASQYEPLAQCILTATVYPPGTPTLYSLLWDVECAEHKEATRYQHMEAINLWLSVLYRFRFSALEDVRRINMEINIQGKNKPPYIDGAARLPGTTPEHYGMENIVGLLGAIIDAEDTSLKLKPKPKDREQRLGVEEWYVELVTGDETECVSTNRWLMKQALSLTTHNWKTKDLKRGTKGRTSALRKIARWFWIATHTPYAQLVHDKGPATETGEVYEGWDSVYLKKARIATMFAAFDPWATWYKLGPIDDPDVEGLNEEGQDGANVEDLAMFHSMRSLDGQIAGANHALKTMNDIFMKNPLFHCIVTDPKTNKPVKTLKRPVVRVLQSLYELCDEEVCNTAKHLLQDEYDYDEPLNDENRQMIHDRMLVLHEGHVIPTQRDLTLWHSPKTMEQIKKTESHANPDIERLNAARLKRSAEAEKAAKAGEKKIRRIGGIPKVNRPTMPKLTMRELLAAPPPVARKKTVSASQQERDEALIAEVERRDNDEREAAAAGKGKGKEKAVQDDQVSEGSNLTDLEDLVEEPESEEGVENEDADTSNNEGPPCNQLALASTSRSVSPSKGKRRLSAADHTVVSKRQKGEQDLTVGEVLVPSSSQVAGSSQGSMLDEDFSRLIHGGN